MKRLQVETVAQAYLDLLEDRGVTFFLANAGTDFAPLVDAFARRHAEGRRNPRPIVVPHESVAVGMAHGCWLASGRPQAVMVHVTVGTANAACGIITASRSQVPGGPRPAHRARAGAPPGAAPRVGGRDRAPGIARCRGLRVG